MEQFYGGPSIDPAIIIPLANNGGPTWTHALPANSPAVDWVDSGLCPKTDQRGFRRPLDGNGDGIAFCDIGAFERGLPVYLPLIRR